MQQTDLGLTVAARAVPPAVMFVFDRSGSMHETVDPLCTTSQCPTRISEARAWAGDMLSQLSDQARWGLQIYPADSTCGPSTQREVLLGIPSVPGAAGLMDHLMAVTPMGGTPTAQSLALAAQVLPTDGAEKIVLLLTDGVPNCNIDNPNTCVTQACSCTISPCPTTLAANDTNFCARGCLDADATNAEIQSMGDVQVVVVAFGPDFMVPKARHVADQMASDGNHEPCVGGSDCMSGVCNANRCATQAFTARMATGLAAATDALKGKLQRSARCRYVLDRDPSGSTVRAFFGDTERPSAEVSVKGRVVQLLGSSCSQLFTDPALQPHFFLAEP